MERKILHVDMDAFFASVEIKDNPKLKGKPVIVGGISERGVVATCSYEARAYGIRSAMPVYIAKAKCSKAIFLPVRMYRYKEISSKIFDIFYSVTPYVEPVSIDEAYLDITHLNKDPIKIALLIKENVLKELGLTLSIGISYNKFLAKLASDWNKPNGIKVITKEMVPKVLFPLSINKVHGLGKKSVKKLNNIGVFNIEELYALSKDFIINYFGKSGLEIYDRIRGIDNRKVNTFRERKSIGREITLKKDTKNKQQLKWYIENFAEFIENTLEKENMQGKTITIKLKTTSFETHTKSKTLLKYICKSREIQEYGNEMLNEIELE
ncbi:DNA polymerase IV [Hathewaya limosa]|uniref:DNA polymerase IV n=1 Tax=Hathewaya limosa TaxID=1536 RepID=A0ABU0JTM8_HATLI|nr:DNA polymerase-4 [Hathewaya limosa]